MHPTLPASITSLILRKMASQEDGLPAGRVVCSVAQPWSFPLSSSCRLPACPWMWCHAGFLKAILQALQENQTYFPRVSLGYVGISTQSFSLCKETPNVNKIRIPQCKKWFTDTHCPISFSSLMQHALKEHPVQPEENHCWFYVWEIKRRRASRT